VEQRGEYRGQREDRRFSLGVLDAPTTRSSTAASSSSATISGTVIQYSPTRYVVNDKYGSFRECVDYGAVTAALPQADVRFLAEHSGLALARTRAGTLTMADTPTGLSFRAVLDPRSPLAAAVIVACGRGDVNQASIGMIVEEDSWNEDFSERRITRLTPTDCSVVSFPASPTTSAALLDAPPHLMPEPRGMADLEYVAGEIRRALAEAQSELRTTSGTGTALRLETELLKLQRRRPAAIKPRKTEAEKRRAHTLKVYNAATKGR
jgi:HK97 family phage prohead protease